MGESPSVSSPLYYVKKKKIPIMSVCERKIGARENFQPLGLRSETNIEKVSEINIFQKQITWEVRHFIFFIFFLFFFYFFNPPLY